MEPVDCPKCDGKMVPISGAIQEKIGSIKTLQYASWRCVKCGYNIALDIARP